MKIRPTKEQKDERITSGWKGRVSVRSESSAMWKCFISSCFSHLVGFHSRKQTSHTSSHAPTHTHKHSFTLVSRSQIGRWHSDCNSQSGCNTKLTWQLWLCACVSLCACVCVCAVRWHGQWLSQFSSIKNNLYFNLSFDTRQTFLRVC